MDISAGVSGSLWQENDDSTHETPLHSFQAALKDFKETLKPGQQEAFLQVTLDNMKYKILSIQREQDSHKSLINLSRIKFFLKKFAEKAQSIKLGDPFGADTFQGPQVSQQQFDVSMVIMHGNMARLI